MDSIISDQLSPIELSIGQIYLDPNNPRFVHDGWTPILDEMMADVDVQTKTFNRMMERVHRVDQVLINMEINGYLPIDRVIVREFKQGKYVVLEGNRRITAAKILLKRQEKGDEIGEAILASLHSIPCLEYTGLDEDAAWVFQGIRHITGIRAWSAYNKAKLLSEQREDGQTLTEVGKIFGLSGRGAGQWIRGYKAFRQAKDGTDFGRVMDERAYPFFQELFGRSNPPLREWLGWNEVDFRCDNELNFIEFLSWLYPPPQDVENEIEFNGDDEENVPGDWNERIIGNVQLLRKISSLIRNNTENFNQFRESKDLDSAVAGAKEQELAYERQPADQLLRSLDDVIKRLEDIPTRRFRGDDSQREALMTKLDILRNEVDEVIQVMTS